MSHGSQWSVEEPRRLAFDDEIHTLRVRVADGAVNVVGTDAPGARLEVGALSGPPLTVTLEDGVLTVAYDDLPWKGFLTLLDCTEWRRTADVSVAVPAEVGRVEVGVMGADAVVTGVRGRTHVRGLSGGTVLAGLAGPVRAETVSGDVEAQGVTGDLRFGTVSGDLTVVDGGGPSITADSVSGNMVLDLAPVRGAGGANVRLSSVSGEIAIRLPHPSDTVVEANTAGGAVSCAFDDLRVTGQWGTKRITGTLGTGSGRLRAATVSGAIALLRRPPADGPAEEPPGSPESSGSPDAGGDAGTTVPPTTPSLHKDV